ncbi:MAG: T9SS type A sorting domain-containing protein, partial [Ignavibacteria bacterium]|nr:T9SS type A sorting domain-containing protein [Ignavibacteria bacterium]
GINFSDRFNWSTPFVFNPLNSASLFLGSDKMYKTTDRANNWIAISPDLTNGPSPGNLPYGTITTIAVAPSDSNTIYAGTDDANVWVTTNSGANWTNISDSLPNRWITRVAVDNVNPLTAYVTISGYRWGENIGHIYRTTSAGADWNNIHGNLPDAPINDIIVDTERDSTLYIATDVGVFASENLGNSWHTLGNNLPNVVVNDLRLHNPTRTLVAATYGRSMYKIKLDSVSSVQSEVFQKLRFSLEQNFPNPFNSTTKIRFTIPESGYATLQIFDISGKVITILVSRQLSAGNHEIDWSANEISSGVYLFRLTTDTYIETKKLMVIK